jgi:hypothetical protein
MGGHRKNRSGKKRNLTGADRAARGVPAEKWRRGIMPVESTAGGGAGTTRATGHSRSEMAPSLSSHGAYGSMGDETVPATAAPALGRVRILQNPSASAAQSVRGT